MNLRTRVGLAGGAIVLGTLMAVSAVLYPLVADRLRAQRDRSLLDTAANAPATVLAIKAAAGPDAGAGDAGVRLPTAKFGTTLVQILPQPVIAGGTDKFAPVTARDVDVAAGTAPAYFRTVTFEGIPYRVYATPLTDDPGTLVRVAQALTAEQTTLRRLAVLLVLLTGLGAAFAAGTARLVAGRVLQPVRELTETVERVTASQDLTAPIDTRGRDELSRLARSFAAMMAALHRSVTAQRRLVADASHELRTPLTSLTTNLDLLAETPPGPDAQAPVLVREARAQVGELTVLINDLVDLARDGQTEAHVEDIRLDLLVERLVARARHRAPGLRVEARLAPGMVRADPEAVERAVGNLLDNAVKWSPPGGRVEVTADGGTVTVADEGPGIPAADLPFVFDRFYRSPAARTLPGSGLGLAIVRQVAENAGGGIAAEPLPRGVRMRLQLPAVP